VEPSNYGSLYSECSLQPAHNHRLNVELDLQSFFWAPCAQLYSLAETPQVRNPAFGLIYEGAIGQPR
jgi:hypothetical protein